MVGAAMPKVKIWGEGQPKLRIYKKPYGNLHYKLKVML